MVSDSLSEMCVYGVGLSAIDTHGSLAYVTIDTHGSLAYVTIDTHGLDRESDTIDTHGDYLSSCLRPCPLLCSCRAMSVSVHTSADTTTHPFA